MENFEPDRLSAALDHADKIKDSEWVYFLQCNEFVKIGRAIDVLQRVALLQIGNPYKIKLLAAIRTSDCKFFESEFHDKYAQFRERGEWFRLTAEHIEEIKALDTWHGRGAKKWQPPEYKPKITKKTPLRSSGGTGRLRRGWIAYGVKDSGIKPE